MENKKKQLFEFLKGKKAASLEEISWELNVSEDFIRGLIHANDSYKQKEDYVLLSGLGTDRCIVCADTMMDFNSIKISLPYKLQDEYGIKYPLSDGIKGHVRCYTEAGVFARFDKGFICGQCNRWYGGWIDGDEVEESCSTLGQKRVGHPGVIHDNQMCNFFTLAVIHKLNTTPEKYKKRQEEWEKIKPEMEKEKQKGYDNLVKLLENAHLIEHREAVTNK